MVIAISMNNVRRNARNGSPLLLTERLSPGRTTGSVLLLPRLLLLLLVLLQTRQMSLYPSPRRQGRKLPRRVMIQRQSRMVVLLEETGSAPPTTTPSSELLTTSCSWATMVVRALASLTSECTMLWHYSNLTDTDQVNSTWGNSLSYLNAKGTGGSSSPKVLKHIYIPSNKEFSIWSAEKCDESCGYVRAKDVAYSMSPYQIPK